MTRWPVVIPDPALSSRWHVSWRHAGDAIVSSASAATLVVVPAAVATLSPTTIRMSASRVLATWAAPALIVRFAFGALHVCVAFGVGHRPTGRGYEEKREYQSVQHIQ